MLFYLLVSFKNVVKYSGNFQLLLFLTPKTISGRTDTIELRIFHFLEKI